MVYCCVPFCKAQYGKYCGVSFHEIPSNDELREKWLDAISREGEQEGSRWIPGDRSHVCSLHFRNEDFKENCKRRMLKGEAVPSLFPAYPVPLQRSVRIKKKRRTSAQGTLFSTSFEEGSKASTEEVVFIKCEPGLSMDEEDSSNFGTNVELPQVKAEPGFENEIPGIIKEEQNNVGFVTMDDAVEFDENGGSLNTIKSASVSRNAGQQATKNLREKENPVQKKNAEEGTCTPGKEALQHPNFKRQRGQYTCTSCGKIFPDRLLLRRHCVNPNLRPYLCTICGRSFYQSGHLKAHSVVHSKAKPSCTKCNKSFTQISSLRKHQIVHMVEKPYSCSVCNKSFKHISYLKQHRSIHRNC
ncbi:zinc finger protein 415 isoform X1 [Anabrus simplex]|uniref:zinc finger protein 415 isoform X1 n=1 Tax=Anabrus simplex TaxID=316456 RepID=UPI0035A28455